MSYPGFIVLSTDNGPAFELEAQGDGADLISDIELINPHARYLELERSNVFTYSVVNDNVVTVNRVKNCNGVFVAVGSTGFIATSATGEDGSWTIRTSGLAINLTSVSSRPDVIVACGAANGYYHSFLTCSTDGGVTWTVNSAAQAYYNVFGSAYDEINDKFVFTGYDDGGGWGTYVTSDPTDITGSFHHAPWGGDAAPAVTANAGVCWAITYGGGIYSSTDSGETWTFIEYVGANMADIHWTGTCFIASGLDRFYHSPAGVGGTWTTGTYPYGGTFVGLSGDAYDIFVCASGGIVRIDPTSFVASQIYGTPGDFYTTATTNHKVLAMGYAGICREANREFIVSAYPTSLDRTNHTNLLDTEYYPLALTPGTITLTDQITFTTEDLSV